ncbi:MAG: organic hydroperoxide resistance protein [Verrucomicrobiota bacterium]
MKTLFTAESTSRGARSGTIQSPDGLLNLPLGNLLEKGIEKLGPNPELLFAGAYSACYHGALGNAAKKLGIHVENSTVRGLVSLIEGDEGGFRLAVELLRSFPELTAPKLSASWRQRTRHARIRKPCGETRLSRSWWTNADLLLETSRQPQ